MTAPKEIYKKRYRKRVTEKKLQKKVLEKVVIKFYGGGNCGNENEMRRLIRSHDFGAKI